MPLQIQSRSDFHHHRFSQRHVPSQSIAPFGLSLAGLRGLCRFKVWGVRPVGSTGNHSAQSKIQRTRSLAGSNPVLCRLDSMTIPRSKWLQLAIHCPTTFPSWDRAVSKLVVSGATYRRLPAMSGLGSSAPSAACFNPSLKRSANGMPAVPRVLWRIGHTRGSAGTASSPA